jgi:hypothetical protein
MLGGEIRQITKSAISILTTPRINTVKRPPLSKETQAVIKALRSYIERAEAGKINGICITTANDDHTYDAEFFGVYAYYPTDAFGPIEILKLKLAREALDRNEI